MNNILFYHKLKVNIKTMTHFQYQSKGKWSTRLYSFCVLKKSNWRQFLKSIPSFEIFLILIIKAWKF